MDVFFRIIHFDLVEILNLLLMSEVQDDDSPIMHKGGGAKLSIVIEVWCRRNHDFRGDTTTLPSVQYFPSPPFSYRQRIVIP